MSRLSLFLLCSAITGNVMAETQFRGFFLGQFQHFTENKKENTGEKFRLHLEHETKFSQSFSMTNQLRAHYNSLFVQYEKENNLSQNESHELYLGENFIKGQGNSWAMQLGYQELAWGEAFGFHYADVVNPKDLRETLYFDYADSRLPLFLMNYRYFFNAGSLQLIYSPEPRFSKSLPFSMFTESKLPNVEVNVRKQKRLDFFKEHEYGLRLSKSFESFDLSYFYFNYIDRSPYLTVESFTPTSLTLKENHQKIQTHGLSLAKTIYDNFVFRSDVVFTQDKQFNTLESLNLSHQSTNLTEVLVSLDTPSYHNISAVFIYAHSAMSADLPHALRDKTEEFAIAKFNYDAGEDKSFDLSYSHQFKKKGHSIQTVYNWPVNNTLELRVGGQFYWGEPESQFEYIKKMSSVFIGLKNYFQL